MQTPSEMLSCGTSSQWRPWRRFRLARYPLERNRSSDKKSRQTKKLERMLIAKVCQPLGTSLQSSVREVNPLWKSPILTLGRLGLFNPPLVATAPS